MNLRKMNKIELLQKHSNKLADDERLWFRAQTITEAYLQARLRKICWMIEEASIDEIIEEIEDLDDENL
jgi:hypothetical protein